MCLIVFAYQKTAGYHLILAANRDEFYERPTDPAAFWGDAPHILGGRDLKGRGTWLGITRCGRFAAITNYRDPGTNNPDAPSRGELIGNFLRRPIAPREYLQEVQTVADRYNGFNLLVGDLNGLFYFSNRGRQVHQIKPGVHGLSNRLLNSSWPKVDKSKEALRKLLANNSDWSSEALLQLLSDRSLPPDKNLPDTGVGLEWERILSPLFITSEAYGTRSSTVLSISTEGRVAFVERNFVPDKAGALHASTRCFSFLIATGKLG